MSLFNPIKSISIITSTLGLAAFSNLIFANSVLSFSVTFDNGGFEESIVNSQNGWNTIGDVTISPTIDGISPTKGSNQAIITTGYIPNNGDIVRDDDNGLNFNKSGNDPVNADTNSNAELQDRFGFSDNAFSIDRSAGATFPGKRISKEGSGMYQDFSVTLSSGETSFNIEFDWAFLSNDGTTGSGGEQDFGFWSLGQSIANDGNYSTVFSSTGNPDDEIIVLQSSNSTPNIENVTPTATTDDYLYEYDYTSNGRYSYSVTGLTPGQTYYYRVGYGVVDVDGLERTSTLLIDNIEVIPFEFSPSFGLILVASIFGFNHWSRKSQLKNNQID